MTSARTLRTHTFAVSFLYSIPFGLLLYFNSSFLHGKGFSSQEVGLLLALGYGACVLLTLALPALLRRFGNRQLFIGGLLLASLLFLLISLSSTGTSVAILLPLAVALSTALYVLLDIFLAATSSDVGKVGGRRGVFVSLKNGAYFIAQLAAIWLLAHAAFSQLYAVTAAALFMLAALAGFLLRDFKDPVYERYNWSGVFARLIASSGLRSVFFMEFLLKIFYSIMVVYTPLYLHEQVGIPFADMGIIFAIMILPFILLDIPVGRFEDRSWSERWVLVVGFVAAALATMALAFIATPNIFVWAAALFLTRVGAALIDIGSETYFFKEVRGGDSGEMSAFRVLFPLSYIIGPVLGAAFLLVLPLQYLFIALGALLLLGVPTALSLPRHKA